MRQPVLVLATQSFNGVEVESQTLHYAMVDIAFDARQ